MRWRYAIGIDMMNETLCWTTSRSWPAISTPARNAFFVAIRSPNSRNAIATAAMVKPVRSLRRFRLLQSSQRCFTDASPSRRLLRVEHALVEMQLALRAVGGVRVVGDHDDGLSVLPVERLEQVEHLVAGLAVEITR